MILINNIIPIIIIITIQGHYCPGDGSKKACPAGRYGNQQLLTTSDCSGSCEAGFYCPEGSVSSNEELCGQGLTPEEAVKRYCPEVCVCVCICLSVYIYVCVCMRACLCFTYLYEFLLIIFSLSY